MTDDSVPTTVAAIWRASNDRHRPKQSMSAFEYTSGMRNFSGAPVPPQTPSFYSDNVSERDIRINASIDAGISKALNETNDAGQPIFSPNHYPKQHRYSRSNYVSELFLAEAKVAQAKVEAAAGSNNSIVSSSTGKKMEKPRFGADSRQNSLSSINAVGPILESNYMAKQLPLTSLRVVDDTIQMTTQHRFSSSSDSDGQQRSFRKPLGLTFAFRRTDSGSTFQSLDGLSSSYPLVRNDVKKKKDGKHRKRSGSSVRSASSNWAFTRCSNVPAFDASRYVCLPTTCFPTNDVGPLGTSSLSSERSRDSQRDSPDRSWTIREDLMMIQSQLRGLRKKPNQYNDEALIDSKDRKKATDIGSALTKKLTSKTVRFAAPLVTKIKYRPFTPQSEIAMLYFQEEELEVN
jgi:hypothetical protein